MGRGRTVKHADEMRKNELGNQESRRAERASTLPRGHPF